MWIKKLEAETWLASNAELQHLGQQLSFKVILEGPGGRAGETAAL